LLGDEAWFGILICIVVSILRCLIASFALEMFLQKHSFKDIRLQIDISEFIFYEQILFTLYDCLMQAWLNKAGGLGTELSIH
jgi:hypothetical protein